MKLFLVSRYDELYPDRNDLSVVVSAVERDQKYLLFMFQIPVYLPVK